MTTEIKIGINHSKSERYRFVNGGASTAGNTQILLRASVEHSILILSAHRRIGKRRKSQSESRRLLAKYQGISQERPKANPNAGWHIGAFLALLKTIANTG